MTEIELFTAARETYFGIVASSEPLNLPNGKLSSLEQEKKRQWIKYIEERSCFCKSQLQEMEKIRSNTFHVLNSTTSSDWATSKRIYLLTLLHSFQETQKLINETAHIDLIIPDHTLRLMMLSSFYGYLYTTLKNLDGNNVQETYEELSMYTYSLFMRIKKSLNYVGLDVGTPVDFVKQTVPSIATEYLAYPITIYWEIIRNLFTVLNSLELNENVERKMPTEISLLPCIRTYLLALRNYYGFCSSTLNFRYPNSTLSDLKDYIHSRNLEYNSVFLQDINVTDFMSTDQFEKEIEAINQVMDESFDNYSENLESITVAEAEEISDKLNESKEIKNVNQSMDRSNSSVRGKRGKRGRNAVNRRKFEGNREVENNSDGSFSRISLKLKDIPSNQKNTKRKKLKPSERRKRNQKSKIESDLQKMKLHQDNMDGDLFRKLDDANFIYRRTSPLANSTFIENQIAQICSTPFQKNERYAHSIYPELTASGKTMEYLCKLIVSGTPDFNGFLHAHNDLGGLIFGKSNGNILFKFEEPIKYHKCLHEDHKSSRFDHNLYSKFYVYAGLHPFFFKVDLE